MGSNARTGSTPVPSTCRGFVVTSPLFVLGILEDDARADFLSDVSCYWIALQIYLQHPITIHNGFAILLHLDI